MFSSRFMQFPTFLENKIPGGGGGGGKKMHGGGKFVCKKNNSFSFHFAFYAISNI